MSDWFGGKTVLVPVDFSDESIKAVDEALTMVDSASQVHVLHVAADLDITTPGVVWETISEDTQRSNVQKSFSKTFADSKYQGVVYHVLFGDAGHQIVEQANAINADVIVMPTHGRTGVRRILLGSTAERVLRLAHIPVLMLRH